MSDHTDRRDVALDDIARQKTIPELIEDGNEVGDLEYAYNTMIARARSALLSAPVPSPDGAGQKPLAFSLCNINSLHSDENADALWILASTLHENVPEDKRPMSWSDFSPEQIERLTKAANAFLAAITSPSGTGAAEPETRSASDLLNEFQEHGRMRHPNDAIPPVRGDRALREAMCEACDLLAERKYGNPARSPGHNARLCLESALSLPVQPSADARVSGEPVAWRYKCHDGQFVYMDQRLTDEQKARGYYHDDDDTKDDADLGPFHWSDETPLYASPQDVGREATIESAINSYVYDQAADPPFTLEKYRAGILNAVKVALSRKGGER